MFTMVCHFDRSCKRHYIEHCSTLIAAIFGDHDISKCSYYLFLVVVGLAVVILVEQLS